MSVNYLREEIDLLVRRFRVIIRVRSIQADLPNNRPIFMA